VGYFIIWDYLSDKPNVTTQRHSLCIFRPVALIVIMYSSLLQAGKSMAALCLSPSYSYSSPATPAPSPCPALPDPYHIADCSGVLTAQYGHKRKQMDLDLSSTCNQSLLDNPMEMSRSSDDSDEVMRGWTYMLSSPAERCYGAHDSLAAGGARVETVCIEEKDEPEEEEEEEEEDEEDEDWIECLNIFCESFEAADYDNVVDCNPSDEATSGSSMEVNVERGCDSCDPVDEGKVTGDCCVNFAKAPDGNTHQEQGEAVTDDSFRTAHTTEAAESVWSYGEDFLSLGGHHHDMPQSGDVDLLLDDPLLLRGQSSMLMTKPASYSRVCCGDVRDARLMSLADSFSDGDDCDYSGEMERELWW
jgi:hypothetical protein